MRHVKPSWQSAAIEVVVIECGVGDFCEQATQAKG